VRRSRKETAVKRRRARDAPSRGAGSAKPCSRRSAPQIGAGDVQRGGPFAGSVVILLAELRHVLTDVRIEQRLMGVLAAIGEHASLDRLTIAIPPGARKRIGLGPDPIDRPDHHGLPSIVGS